nr:uncharacterized protein LOC124813884 [Hydra vulgaris]
MHELNISDADFHENITSDTSLVDVVLSKEDIYQNNNQTCSQSVDAEMRSNGVTSKRLIKDVDDDNNNDIDMNNNAILDKNKYLSVQSSQNTLDHHIQYIMIWNLQMLL